MDAQRLLEYEQRSFVLAGAPQNLAQPAQRAKVARLELERALDIVHAFVVPLLEIVERGAFVPSLGKVRPRTQQAVQSGLGDIIEMTGDIVCGALQGPGRQVMRMVHPQLPDLVFEPPRVALGCTQPLEELVQARGQHSSRAAGPEGGYQVQRF